MGVRPLRDLCLALAAAALLPAAAMPQAARDATGKDLQQQLESWFRKAARSAPGTWGVAVAAQDGRLLWGVEPTRPMIPASTVKVFTTGFARTVLGGEARKETRVVGAGHVDPASGTWIGTWALELNGDPTLERPLRGGPSLADLAGKLRDRGIRRLTGPFAVVSAEGEAGAAWPAAWSPRHRGRIFAPLIGALTLNENTLSFSIAPAPKAGQKPVLVGESPAGAASLVEIRARTVAGRSSRLRYQVVSGGRYIVSGTIGLKARVRRFTSTAPNPKVLLEASWRRALLDAGIEWQESDGLGAAVPASRSVLAAVSSESFDSIASEVNRRSLNLGAELMLRWAAGNDRPADRLTAHVQQVTGDYTSIRLVDGSGLSSEDRASPLAFVAYLAKFPQTPAGHGFSQLLPSNGVGTLRKLAKGFPGPGVVRAKTGTLGNVATLTGYLGRTDGVLVISLMYNGTRVYSARQEQWRLFRLLGAEGVSIPTDTVDAGTQFGSDGKEPPATP